VGKTNGRILEKKIPQERSFRESLKNKQNFKPRALGWSRSSLHHPFFVFGFGIRVVASEGALSYSAPVAGYRSPTSDPLVAKYNQPF
jgi:hypothetical protein